MFSTLKHAKYHCQINLTNISIYAIVYWNVLLPIYHSNTAIRLEGGIIVSVAYPSLKTEGLHT